MRDLLQYQKQKLLSKLEYVVLSGSGDRSFNNADLHNKAYIYWKNFWTRIYSDAQSLDSFSCDDFFRQNFVTLLLLSGEVVGMHLYSVFHLNHLAVQEHHYFKFYPQDFFEFMKERSSDYVMSLEFLTIDPAWRKAECGISLGEVLIGCGLRFFDFLGTSAVIAPARADNKVNQMCYKYGFDCFRDNIVKRNFQVDLVVGFKDKVHPHPDQSTLNLVERLWAERKDHTGKTTPRDPSESAAA